MESDSALNTLAFKDNNPAFHAHEIGFKVGCEQSDDDQFVECMKTKAYTEIMVAGEEYSVRM